jgi:hypothetical protein
MQQYQMEEEVEEEESKCLDLKPLWAFSWWKKLILIIQISYSSWETMALGLSSDLRRSTKSKRWSLSNSDWCVSSYIWRPFLWRIGKWLQVPEWYIRAWCQLLSLDQAKDLRDPATCEVWPLCRAGRFKDNHIWWQGIEVSLQRPPRLRSSHHDLVLGSRRWWCSLS